MPRAYQAVQTQALVILSFRLIAMGRVELGKLVGRVTRPLRGDCERSEHSVLRVNTGA